MEVVQNYLRSTSDSINSLVGSSFGPGQIMLIYALFKRGKTNICLDYALNAAKAKKKVLYIDADIGGVSPTRLTQMLTTKFGITTPNVDGVKLAKFKGIELIVVSKLDQIRDKIFDLQDGKYDLIIIDSLTLFFRTQITQVKGYGGYLSAEVMAIIDKLRAYCFENHAAAIVTAQRTSEIKAVQIAEKARDQKLDASEKVIWREFVGGESLGYYVDLMVEIDSFENGKRKLTMVESRSAKRGSCEFKITDGGIQ